MDLPEPTRDEALREMRRINSKIEAALAAEDCDALAQLFEEREPVVAAFMERHAEDPLPMELRNEILEAEAGLRKRMDALRSQLKGELNTAQKQAHGLRMYTKHSE